MKARYFAAALIGAWWLSRRVRQQEAYTGPSRVPVSPGASGTRARTVPRTPQARDAAKGQVPGI